MLTGCNVDLALDLDMGPDGATEVVFSVLADAEVVANIDLESVVVDDLTDRGWAVVGPINTADGGAVLTLSAVVPQPDRLADVVATLDGGRWFDVREADAVAAFGVTDYELVVGIDPAEPLESLSSAPLTDLLGGEPFGYTTEELEAAAGVPLDETVTLSVRVTTPGGGSEASSTAEITLSDSIGQVAAAASQVVDNSVFEARDEAERSHVAVDRAWFRLAVAWSAAAACVVALVVLLWRRSGGGGVRPTI